MVKGTPRTPVERLKLAGLIEKKPGYYANRNIDSHGTVITPDTILDPSKKYSKETLEAWDLIVPNLIAMQSLNEQDLPELKAMMDSYDDYVKTRKLYMKHKVDLKADEEDLLKQTTVHQKLFNMMGQAKDQFNKLAMRFGCTPTERSRLPINSNKREKEDPLEVALSGQ